MALDAYPRLETLTSNSSLDPVNKTGMSGKRRAAGSSSDKAKKPTSPQDSPLPTSPAQRRQPAQRFDLYPQSPESAFAAVPRPQQHRLQQQQRSGKVAIPRLPRDVDSPLANPGSYSGGTLASFFLSFRARRDLRFRSFLERKTDFGESSIQPRKPELAMRASLVGSAKRNVVAKDRYADTAKTLKSVAFTRTENATASRGKLL